METYVSVEANYIVYSFHEIFGIAFNILVYDPLSFFSYLLVISPSLEPCNRTKEFFLQKFAYFYF